MTRRSFLAAAAAPLLAQGPQRPNVLIFLSDQESERVDRSLLRLPNRDKLDGRGVHFTRNWCATPQCSPARSAILTGLFPHATGVVANVGAVGSGPLSADFPSLGRLFKAAGYETGYFGKWHLTAGRRIPEEFGFDEASSRGDEPGDAGIAAAAADWIRGREGPWLAFVSVIQPHDIYYFSRLKGNGEAPAIRDGIAAPASGAEQLSSKPPAQQLYNEKDQGQTTADYGPQEWRGYRSLYYDLIEDADLSLGAVLDSVEANSQVDDTIAVYTSDHGDALGEHGLAFKGPFMYEELLNVPLTISWPKLTPSAQTSDALTSQVDLLPTLCELTGVAAPQSLQGKSLAPLLRGEAFEREANFAEYHSKQRWANPIRSVRTNRWKLNVYLSGERELYDLENDPHETRNLAGSGAESETKLLALIENWARSTTDRRWFD